MRKDNKVKERTIPIISDFDWRLDGVEYEELKSTSIVTHPIKINNKKTNFLTPNPTALFLDISHNLYIKACKTYKFEKLKEPDSIMDAKKYFNSLEFYIGSIIFAYTSIESFVNEVIPKGYVHKKQKTKCTEIYTKDQIEYLQLDEKLKNILPEIIKIASIAQTQLWSEYIELRDIRHQIIHLKTKNLDYISSQNKFDHIWNRIINNGNFIDYSIKAKLIIEYYINDAKPRWLRLCPF